MNDPKKPQKGDMHIDATDVPTVNFTRDHVRSMTKLRPGYEKAVANLAWQTEAQLKVAGISPEEVSDIVALAADHKHIGALYEASAHMTEVLRDTHLDRGHKLSTRLAEVLEQARRRAERSPNGAEILGALEDLVMFQLGPAMKAAATKMKAKVPPNKGGEAPKAGEGVNT